MNTRIGYGYDIHQLIEGTSLCIGGIKIQHDKTALAHSDGDVLIHAICDALLGAAALGDIGSHFPDNDPAYRDMDSKIILEQTMQIIQNHHFAIGNIDSTIILEKPKLKDHIPRMISTLTSIMHLNANQLSIKATTHEKLGPLGNEEAIACHAVALLAFNPTAVID